MRNTGKILGTLFGFLLLSPSGLGLIGAVLGFLLGNKFDKGLGQLSPGNAQAQQAAQRVFSEVTFSVMGYLAKSDGRVCEDEIRVARNIMDKIGFNPSQREAAMAQFNMGKSADFNLDEALNRLTQACHRYRNLLRMFLDIQIQAAYANKVASPQQQRILQSICQRLGVGSLNFDVLNMIYGQGFSGFHQQHHAGQHQQQRAHTAYQDVDAAYAILAVNKTATEAEVKRAYRKLMSQNHPDKLVAKGLPPEMIKLATEKTQAIQKAYETICKAKLHPDR